MKIVAIISIALLLFVSTTNGQMFVDTLDIADDADPDCSPGDTGVPGDSGAVF